jgi:hypothetical protein
MWLWLMDCRNMGRKNGCLGRCVEMYENHWLINRIPRRISAQRRSKRDDRHSATFRVRICREYLRSFIKDTDHPSLRTCSFASYGPVMPPCCIQEVMCSIFGWGTVCPVLFSPSIRSDEGDPPRWPPDTPLSVKVGTKFRQQLAVAQSL